MKVLSIACKSVNNKAYLTLLEVVVNLKVGDPLRVETVFDLFGAAKLKQFIFVQLFEVQHTHGITDAGDIHVTKIPATNTI